MSINIIELRNILEETNENNQINLICEFLNNYSEDARLTNRNNDSNEVVKYKIPTSNKLSSFPNISKQAFLLHSFNRIAHIIEEYGGLKLQDIVDDNNFPFLIKHLDSRSKEGFEKLLNENKSFESKVRNKFNVQSPQEFSNIFNENNLKELNKIIDQINFKSFSKLMSHKNRHSANLMKRFNSNDIILRLSKLVDLNGSFFDEKAQKIIDLFKSEEINEYNCGLKDDDSGNKIFVVNVPKFPQFSVHVVPTNYEDLEELEISLPEYDDILCEKTNFILTPLETIYSDYKNSDLYYNLLQYGKEDISFNNFIAYFVYNNPKELSIRDRYLLFNSLGFTKKEFEFYESLEERQNTNTRSALDKLNEIKQIDYIETLLQSKGDREFSKIYLTNENDKQNISDLICNNREEKDKKEKLKILGNFCLLESDIEKLNIIKTFVPKEQLNIILQESQINEKYLRNHTTLNNIFCRYLIGENCTIQDERLPKTETKYMFDNTTNYTERLDEIKQQLQRKKGPSKTQNTYSLSNLQNMMENLWSSILSSNQGKSKIFQYILDLEKYINSNPKNEKNLIKNYFNNSENNENTLEYNILKFLSQKSKSFEEIKNLVLNKNILKDTISGQKNRDNYINILSQAISLYSQNSGTDIINVISSFYKEFKTEITINNNELLSNKYKKSIGFSDNKKLLEILEVYSKLDSYKQLDNNTKSRIINIKYFSAKGKSIPSFLLQPNDLELISNLDKDTILLQANLIRKKDTEKPKYEVSSEQNDNLESLKNKLLEAINNFDDNDIYEFLDENLNYTNFDNEYNSHNLFDINIIRRPQDKNEYRIVYNFAKIEDIELKIKILNKFELDELPDDVSRDFSSHKNCNIAFSNLVLGDYIEEIEKISCNELSEKESNNLNTILNLAEKFNTDYDNIEERLTEIFGNEIDFKDESIDDILEIENLPKIEKRLSRIKYYSLFLLSNNFEKTEELNSLCDILNVDIDRDNIEETEMFLNIDDKEDIIKNRKSSNPILKIMKNYLGIKEQYIPTEQEKKLLIDQIKSSKIKNRDLGNLKLNNEESFIRIFNGDLNNLKRIAIVKYAINQCNMNDIRKDNMLETLGLIIQEKYGVATEIFENLEFSQIPSKQINISIKNCIDALNSFYIESTRTDEARKHGNDNIKNMQYIPE